MKQLNNDAKRKKRTDFSHLVYLGVPIILGSQYNFKCVCDCHFMHYLRILTKGCVSNNECGCERTWFDCHAKKLWFVIDAWLPIDGFCTCIYSGLHGTGEIVQRIYQKEKQTDLPLGILFYCKWFSFNMLHLQYGLRLYIKI